MLARGAGVLDCESFTTYTTATAMAARLVSTRTAMRTRARVLMPCGAAERERGAAVALPPSQSTAIGLDVIRVVSASMSLFDAMVKALTQRRGKGAR